MPYKFKSKCRSRFSAGQSAAFPLVAVCFVAFLFEQIDVGLALRCYQGQTSVKMPISGSPVECPIQAYTCIISADYSQGLVTRACQSTNCTLPGNYTISYANVCVNSTSYPPMTFCCCYGDGCNANTTNPPLPAPQLTSLLPSNTSVCSPRGTWGTWSDWSECPNSADPIFELLSDINMQTRNRDCLPQPSGCIRSGTFMCDGQHWEQRPCGKRPSGNGTATTNFMSSGFLTMMPNGTG